MTTADIIHAKTYFFKLNNNCAVYFCNIGNHFNDSWKMYLNISISYSISGWFNWKCRSDWTEQLEFIKNLCKFFFFNFKTNLCSTLNAFNYMEISSLLFTASLQKLWPGRYYLTFTFRPFLCCWTVLLLLYVVLSLVNLFLLITFGFSTTNELNLFRSSVIVQMLVKNHLDGLVHYVPLVCSYIRV